MNVSATAMPSGVNAILIPCGANSAPINPFCEYNVVNATPATAVGSANGRSTSASAIARPVNR